MPESDLTSHHVATHRFVATLEPSDVEWLQRHATAETYAAGDVIFEAGSSADGFYLLRTGLVALRLGEDRRPARIVQTVSEGAALGWSWLYPPYVWQFTAEARSVVRLLSFPAEALRAEFAEDPSFGYRMVARLAETMAERLHHARSQLLDLSHG